jgi:hypothetical protein
MNAMRPNKEYLAISRISRHSSAKNGRSASGTSGLSVLDQCPHGGDDLARALRDEDAELAQQTAQHLLGHRLDRDRMNLLVAAGLEDALGVGTVGLVASDVGTHVVRQQQHPVTELKKSRCPAAPGARGREPATKARSGRPDARQ